MRRLAALTLIAATIAVASAEDPAPAKAQKIVRKVDGAVRRLAVSPDGKWLAAAGVRQGAPTVFATDGARQLEPFAVASSPGGTGRTFGSLCFTADSRFLVVQIVDRDPSQRDATGTTGVFAVADLSTGAVSRTFESVPQHEFSGVSPYDHLHSFAPVPGGPCIRVERSCCFEVWDCGAGRRRSVAAKPEDLSATTFSPDGAWAAKSYFHRTAVNDAATDAERWTSEAETASPKDRTAGAHAIQSVAGFTPDGATLVLVASRYDATNPLLGRPSIDRRTARLEGWRTADGKRLWTTDVDPSAASEPISVGADACAQVHDGKIAFFSVQTGMRRDRDPPLADRRYTCVAFAPDGLSLWAGAEDGQVLKVKTFAATKSK